MERRLIETPLGQIALSGNFRGNRPYVVVIRGAYATEDQFSQMQNFIPSADVIFGDIPGNRSPFLSVNSIKSFSEAYTLAIESLGNPTVVCGNSLGGLIALGIRSENVFSIVSIEPPIKPTYSKSLRSAIAGIYHKSKSSVEKSFLYDVFGASAEGFHVRDYSWILSELNINSILITGSDTTDVPSVLSDSDADILKSHPFVTLERVAGVGHAVHRG